MQHKFCIVEIKIQIFFSGWISINGRMTECILTTKVSQRIFNGIILEDPGSSPAFKENLKTQKQH